jgi:hypothetical protein
MKLHFPWQKTPVPPARVPPISAVCPHPRVEVELHGTAIKRRWCAVCGQELPLPERVVDEE